MSEAKESIELVNSEAAPATQPQAEQASLGGHGEHEPLASGDEPLRETRKEDDHRDGDDKTPSRHRDRDRKDRKSRDKDRERHRDKDRGRDRDRDRDRQRDDKGDRRRDRDSKEPKRSRRSRSRDRRRRDSRERRSSRRSRSRSQRRSRSPRDRRRSRSRTRHHGRTRSRSRSRDRRSRRRRSESSGSDFGGYVPRKRQEAPQAAAGYSTAFIDPYAALRSKQPMPTDPEAIKKKMQEDQLRARQMVLQQQASSAVAAASKTQREIYVGNLVQGLVTEEALRQLFNSTMKAAFPEQQIPGADPVVSVSMHSEGRYAFVELRTPDMASAALQLSGQVQLLGQSISVGRPSGYVDPSAAQMAAAQAATALQAFEAGQLNLLEATDAMNNIAMPGVSASQPPGTSPMKTSPLALPPPPANGAAAATASSAELPEALPLPSDDRTAFLQVEGMVNEDVLTDNEEYAEIIEDLQEECSKFGQLLNVVVPRPPDPSQSASLIGQGFYGKAFVHFGSSDDCAKARAAIHGRLFAGTTIQAAFVTEATFQQASA